MTTRSGTPASALDSSTPLVDLQQDHRHVVVLRRVADERGNLAQHPLAELVGRQVRVRLDQLAQPRSRRSSRRATFIASLMPSVKNR